MPSEFVFAPSDYATASSVPQWVFARAMAEDELHLHQRRTSTASFELSTIFLEPEWRIVTSMHEADGDVQVVAEFDSSSWAWLIYSASSRRVTIWVCAVTSGLAANWCEKLAGRFTAPEVVDDSVPLHFWAQTDNGPRAWVREITAPTWAELQLNYTRTAHDKVDQLMRLRPPISAGQLILWHGPPGTGKTHAIRALCREWRPWCDAHYVVDPDRFFGEGAYMLHVLLESGNQETPVDESLLPELEETLSARERWQLLIVEDADELMSQDAKEKTGQALSRLLNLCDGLIGQGLRTLVLITTNAPLISVHPAVARPGRCLAEVEFGLLNGTEIGRWFKQVDLERPHGIAQAPLSELYDLTRDQHHIGDMKHARSVGTYV